MSYFKRFTVFLSFVGVFSSAVHLISKYISYEPNLSEEGVSKIKEFFSLGYGTENRHYLLLALLLLLSAVFSISFVRLRVMSLFFSFLPLLHVFDMIWADEASSQPMLYFSVAALTLAGGIYECMYYDRRSAGDRKTFCAATLFGGISLVSCIMGIYFFKRFFTAHADYLEEVTVSDSFETYQSFRFFGVNIFGNFTEEGIHILTVLLIMLIISLMLSFVWRGVYFLDAATSLVPLVYVIYQMNSGVIFPNPMSILLGVTVYFICRVLLIASPSRCNEGVRSADYT